MMELELTRPSLVERLPVAPWDAEDDTAGSATLAEAIEARTVVERAIVRLAAYRRTEADLRRLREALELMRTAGDDREAFNRGDFAFHVALSEAAHNGLLAGALASLHGLVRHMIDLYSDTAFRDGEVSALVAAHARLADAVSRRDADAAPAIVSEMMIRLREETDVRACGGTRTLTTTAGHSARPSKGDRS